MAPFLMGVCLSHLLQTYTLSLIRQLQYLHVLAKVWGRIPLLTGWLKDRLVFHGSGGWKVMRHCGEILGRACSWLLKVPSLHSREAGNPSLFLL